MKNQLITHDYDYFDFIHTVLPTALSLKEFYEEYHRLYTKAIPFTKGLSLLNKFPRKEIPSILTKTYRWRRRLRTAYLDYGITFHYSLALWRAMELLPIPLKFI
ncbi:MAG: hypothetical protein ACE5IW_11100 [bacterium]